MMYMIEEDIDEYDNTYYCSLEEIDVDIIKGWGSTKEKAREDLIDSINSRISHLNDIIEIIKNGGNLDGKCV